MTKNMGLEILFSFLFFSGASEGQEKRENDMNSYSFIVVVIVWTMDHFFYVGAVQYVERSGWYLLVLGAMVYHP